MARIQQRFQHLKHQGSVALVPFITAGDPSPQATVPLLHAMVGAGADLLELGVPFSDPMADGPVIQRASERALANGVSLRGVLEMVRDFRRQDSTTPVILMGYLNPIEAMGYQQFAQAAAEVGVDAVITVDLPPEEGEPLWVALDRVAVAPVFLISPTTTEDRMDRICSVAKGFVYYVSLRGVTGSDRLDIAEIRQRLDRIKSHTKLPIGVGFGIRDAQTANEVGQFADAVIVGSAIVSRIEAQLDQPDAIEDAVTEFLAELRSALVQARPQIASGS